MFEFLGCQIVVPPQQMSAIVRTESSANPFAIGVVGGHLNRQPRSLSEAIKVTTELRSKGFNYSIGLAQVNKINFKRFSMTHENGFNKCKNLNTGSKILKECMNHYKNWNKAYSCYYSGNPITGFSHGYVRKVNKNIKKPILTSVKRFLAEALTKIYFVPRNKSKQPKQLSSLAKQGLVQSRLSSSIGRKKLTEQTKQTNKGLINSRLSSSINNN